MFNIIIWGTGDKADYFMKKIYHIYSEMVKVVGFIDDREDRTGTFFHGFKVNSPMNLNKTISVDFIVQFETSSNLTESESISKLDVNLAARYIKYDNFAALCVCKFGLLKKKKIVFFGNEIGFIRAKPRLRFLLDKYEYINDIEKVLDADYDFIFLCTSWQFNIFDNKKYEQMLQHKLRKKGVDPKKIILTRDWNPWLFSDIEIETRGNNNPDKKFYIITPQDESNGWASFLLEYMSDLSYCRKNDLIPVVDMKYSLNQYTDCLGQRDIWENFFYQAGGYSIDEVYESKNVIFNGLNNHHFEEKDISGLNLKVGIKELFDKEFNNLFSHRPQKVLAAVYRGTDFYTAFGHHNPPSLDSFIENVKRLMSEYDCDYVFIASEIKQIIDRFTIEFKDKAVFADQIRFDEKERRVLSSIHFERDEDGYNKAKEYLRILYFLLKCDVLYGSKCGATELVTILKKYEFFQFSNANEIKSEISDLPLTDRIQWMFKESEQKNTEILKKVVRNIKRRLSLAEYRNKRY